MSDDDRPAYNFSSLILQHLCTLIDEFNWVLFSNDNTSVLPMTIKGTNRLSHPSQSLSSYHAPLPIPSCLTAGLINMRSKR